MERVLTRAVDTSEHKESAEGVSFLIPQQRGRFKCHNHTVSKYSICNIQHLPKAADLRKKAFDEFPLNMAIVLQLLSRNALITFQFIPRSQGLSTELHAWTFTLLIN